MRNTVTECVEKLEEDESNLKDMNFIQLCGLLFTLIYIQMTRPEVIISTHPQIIKDLVTNRVSLLCKSKRPSVLLAFYTILVQFEIGDHKAGKEEGLEDTPISILMTNIIIKVKSMKKIFLFQDLDVKVYKITSCQFGINACASISRG